MYQFTQVPEEQTTSYYQIADGYSTSLRSDWLIKQGRNPNDEYTYEDACKHLDEIKHHIYEGRFSNKNRDFRIEKVVVTTISYRPVITMRVAEYLVKNYLNPKTNISLPPEFYVYKCKDLDDHKEFFTLLRIALQQQDVRDGISDQVKTAIQFSREVLRDHYTTFGTSTHQTLQQFAEEYAAKKKLKPIIRNICLSMVDSISWILTHNDVNVEEVLKQNFVVI